MRRLSLIRTAGLDAIVRADRNVELLFCVAIEVADEKVHAAVLRVVPPLEGGCDAGALLADRRRERQGTRALTDALPSRTGQRAARRAHRQQSDTSDETSAHPA